MPQPRVCSFELNQIRSEPLLEHYEFFFLALQLLKGHLVEGLFTLELRDGSLNPVFEFVLVKEITKLLVVFYFDAMLVVDLSTKLEFLLKGVFQGFPFRVDGAHEVVELLYLIFLEMIDVKFTDLLLNSNESLHSVSDFGGEPELLLLLVLELSNESCF